MSVPMWTLIAKNSDSTATVTIDDLGITIDAGGQITLSDHYEYDQLAASDDLRQLVYDGDIVINDGSDDLSAANGVKYLTFIHSKYLSDNHYTKTEISTSGQSNVHWDNLTNVPPFGSPRWLTPVLARVIAIQSAAPSGTEGQFYIDTDDNHLYKYITSSWVDQGAPSDDDRVINLDSTSQVIYQYDLGGDSWDAQSDPSEGDAVLVTDDGDGKQAQYVYDLSALSWVKIADVDWEGNTLDESYDEGGAGAGRIITVDSGAVKLDATSGTYAPIELTQQASAPSSGLAAGQLTVVGGIPYVYDGTRSKWLSIQRGFFAFGRQGLTRSQYLDFYVGSLTSNNSGLRIVRDATIVSLSGQFSSSGTGTFQIRKNDSSSNISTLLLSATSGAGDTTININLDAGDYLQAAMSATAPFVNDPIIIVEIAWRI